MTDRSFLRRLFKWTMNIPQADFTIECQSVKPGTLLLGRSPNAPNLRLNSGRGYGSEFEKATCHAPDLGCAPDGEAWQSSGHYRIINYQFGGLSFLVRSEVDGCTDEAGATPGPLGNGSSADLDKRGPDEIATPVAVVKGGLSVAQERIIEVKSYAVDAPYRFRTLTTKVGDQLFFGQVAQVKLGHHEDGAFEYIEDLNLILGQHSQMYIKRPGHCGGLGRLVGLLQAIREKAAAMPRGRATVVFSSGDRTKDRAADESLSMYGMCECTGDAARERMATEYMPTADLLPRSLMSSAGWSIFEGHA